jgi:hypothetical protein
MLYGYHIDFVDEAGLRIPRHSDARATVTVARTDVRRASGDFAHASDWIALSGQRGRYHSDAPFGPAHRKVAWALEIEGVMTLTWDPERLFVGYIPHEGYTPERLRFWIYHTFFPMVLELQAIYHLYHVGAVALDGGAVLFSAPSFGGKSTLTDYFIRQGHPLLGDDTIGIEATAEGYRAIASYPYHRPYRQPEVLGYPAAHFVQRPLPIAAYYQLDRACADAPVKITPLFGIEKFKALYQGIFMTIKSLRDEQFAYAARLANHLPVYRLQIPWQLSRLDEVHETVCGHITPAQEHPC